MRPDEQQLMRAALDFIDDAMERGAWPHWSRQKSTELLRARLAMPKDYEPKLDLMATATMPEADLFGVVHGEMRVGFSLEELAERHGGTMHELTLDDAQDGGNREGG